MKEVARRIWNEPAVFIGLLTSMFLLTLNLFGEPDWTAEKIIAICAPFASSLGIRQLVEPTHKQAEEPPKVAV